MSKNDDFKGLFIRARGENRWLLCVDLGMDPLTRRQREATKAFAGTRDAAGPALIEFAAKVRNKPIQASAKMTLNQLIEMTLAVADIETLTLVGYRSKFRTHVEPSVVGHKPIGEISALDLTKFYKALEVGGHIKSVHHVARLISRTYGQSIKWPELGLTSNPALGAIIPTNKTTVEKQAPTDEVLAAILDHAATEMPQILTALKVAAFLGPRRGECASLRLSNLESKGDDYYLHVTHSLIHIAQSELAAGVLPRTDYVQLDEMLWMKGTKTNSNRRSLIDTNTATAIGEHLQWLDIRARIAGVDMVDDPFLFSERPDCSIPWEPDRLTGQWKKLCKAAGHPGVRLHDLRHYYGTMLGASGISLKTIMELMGHTQQSTALRYQHKTEEEERRASKAMGSIASRLLAKPA